MIPTPGLQKAAERGSERQSHTLPQVAVTSTWRLNLSTSRTVYSCIVLLSSNAVAFCNMRVQLLGSSIASSPLVLVLLRVKVTSTSAIFSQNSLSTNPSNLDLHLNQNGYLRHLHPHPCSLSERTHLLELRLAFASAASILPPDISLGSPPNWPPLLLVVSVVALSDCR